MRKPLTSFEDHRIIFCADEGPDMEYSKRRFFIRAVRTGSFRFRSGNVYVGLSNGAHMIEDLDCKMHSDGRKCAVTHPEKQFNG